MRVKLTLQYKGTHYQGWQSQPSGKTIQQTLEKALFQILQKKISVAGSSRTDSGVHALCQVCHFDLPEESQFTDKKKLPKLAYGLNSLLPDDIVISNIEQVPLSFHAQKSAKRKIYEYTILNSFTRSPFLSDYSWQIPYPLDIKKMRQAAKILIGEHDFKAFCASGSSVKSTVRRIYRLKISLKKHLICISIEGNGFLKQMVRNIVGSLVEIGKKKMTLVEFHKGFQSTDRSQLGPTAPAKGLILKKVIY